MAQANGTVPETDLPMQVSDTDTILAMILLNMAQGVMILDPSLRIVLMSDRYREMIDLPLGQVSIGEPVQSLIRFLAERGDFGPGDIDAIIDSRIERFSRNSVGRFELALANGTVLDVSSRRTATNGHILTYTDITDLRRREREHEAKSVMLEAILENMDEGIATFDADLNIVNCNQQYSTMCGLPSPADAGLHGELDSGGSGDLIDDVISRIVGDEAHSYRRTQPDGKVLEVRNRPMPDGGVVRIYRDITARDQSETEMRLVVDAQREIMKAGSTTSALGAALRIICTSFGWAYGDAWMVDRRTGRLDLCPEWYGEEGDLGLLREAGEASSFSLDRGVASRISRSRLPEWIPVVADAEPSDFARRDAALRCGIVSALFVPVLDEHDDVVAILAFMMRRPEADRERTARLVGAVVAQIGAFVGRKVAEDALRESEARYRTVLDHAYVPVTLKGMDGRYVLVNRLFAERRGLSPEACVGKTTRELFEPEIADLLDSLDRKVIETQQAHRDEFTILGGDGVQRHYLSNRFPIFDGEGKLTLIGSINAETTDQVRARAEIREKQMLLKNVLDTIPQFVFWKDRESRFIGCNTNFARLLGFERPEEIVGKDDFDLPVTREEAEFYRSVDQEVMDKAVPRLNLEETLHDPDGRERYLLTSKVPLLGNEGEVAGMLGIFADITERKQLEKQLRQSQKMEAVGQLTGGVAHDFNNLLMVVTGNLQLLERKVKDDARQAKQVQMALDAARRGAELTKRLLAFSRQQVLDPKVVDVNEAVRELQPLIRRAVGESVEIELARRQSSWPVKIDVGQFESALLNLAINARDAMPAGGKLVIETRNLRLDTGFVARHADVSPGPYVAVTVADTGAGIPAGIVDRVFDPFFTTKEVGKGSGLGLSMVYGFMKQSHGEATIYSEEGEGTAVTLYFPVAEEAALSEPGDDDGASEDMRGSGTVLVVEDDEAVRFTVTSVLEDMGYTVIVAKNGAEGLDAIRANRDVDLLLTDVVMPGGMNGRELAEAGRRERPGLKVLLTSGYPQDAISRDGILDAGIDFIGKPYEHAELGRKIRRILAA